MITVANLKRKVECCYAELSKELVHCKSLGKSDDNKEIQLQRLYLYLYALRIR